MAERLCGYRPNLITGSVIWLGDASYMPLEAVAGMSICASPPNASSSSTSITDVRSGRETRKPHYNQISVSREPKGVDNPDRRSSGPQLFTNASVRVILHNTFYAEFVKYNGERMPGIHEPVVVFERW